MKARDNIIDWVTQVDMAFLKRTEPWNMFDKYEAFAALIRADEREACAKVCDELHWPWNMGDNSGPKECAAGIRARAAK